MQIKQLICICVLFTFLTPFLVPVSQEARAQTPTGLAQEPPPDAQAIAAQGKETLKKIIIRLLNGNNTNRWFLDKFGLKGIEKASDVNELELGSPLTTYRISLKTLETFQTATDLRTSLPTQPTKFLYPIIVGEDVRSSLSVSRDRSNNKWMLTEWSDAGLIKRVREIQMRYPNAKSILRIPGLNRYYLADETDELRVIPIDKKDPALVELGPKLGLTPDQAIAASTIFDELRKQTQEVLAQQRKLRISPFQKGFEKPVR